MKGLLLAGAALAGFAALSDTGEMRLLSLNARHCLQADGRADVGPTAARIRAEDPDFASLQELDWLVARSGVVDQPAELARRTGLHATFAKEVFLQGGQHGVAVLSRETPKDVVQVPLPGDGPRVLLLCEFADCVVGSVHGSALRDSRAVARVREALAAAGGDKPVFVNGERALSGSGPDARCPGEGETVLRTVPAPPPRVPAPALVPAPASLTVRDGICRVKAGAVSADVVARRTVDAGVPREGYRVEIGAEGVSVAAADDAGFFYALQTLRQLAFFSGGRLAFPCCAIEDAPRFGWRGVMIDDSRHFFGKATVKRTLELMAQHKLNVLHWHLTDSQGWRLPVARHPLLTTVGAARPHSTNRKNLADHYEGGTYGPFAYSEADIREVVAFARARHVRIVPEVDFPGHSRAALKAYPQFRCFPDGKGEPHGAVDNVFCVGSDAALAFMKDVLDAVVRLFPDSDLVHIGGDEVNKVNWRACPKCQARMKALGLGTENDLQAWLAREIGAHLAARGRRVVGWDELVLDGAPPEGLVAMSWRGAEGGRAAAKAGLEAVMCPHFHCYFDYMQCLPDDPAVYPWFTERLSLRKAYSYDPLEGIPPEQRRFIRGGQCCNWSEYTCNETELDWKMWPRACATAEVFWTPAARRDFADFERRMETHRRRLLAQHVNCAPLR